MKFSNKTISILRNFSVINPSIMFRSGKILTTISPQKTIMAKAVIEDEIESDFGIFDLSRFLSVLSLFNDPELILEKNYVKIVDNKQHVNFVFADPENMVLPPNKEMKSLDSYFEFDLSNEQHQALIKAANVLQLPEISVTGTGGSVYYRAIDSKNPSNNSFELEVGNTEKQFNVIFRSENVKIMNDNYHVTLSKGIGHFKSSSLDYWIATESTSKYGD